VADAAAQSTHRATKRALELIEGVAESEGALTLSELAQRVNVPKSTAHALIHTLTTEGFLEREEDTGRFTLGPRLLRLLAQVPGRLALPRIARPAMEAVAEEMNETVLLGVRRGSHSIYVEQVEGREYVRYVAPLGEPRPLYCTSIGKVLLAAMPEADLRALLEEEHPVSLTPHTKTDIGEIVAEARLVAQQGFAVNRGESVDGLTGVAVPIRMRGAPDGAVVAALAVAGPGERVSRKLLDARDRLLRAADEIGLAVNR
jgi:DNA-binding IclR family transcriptional regulator